MGFVLFLGGRQSWGSLRDCDLFRLTSGQSAVYLSVQGADGLLQEKQTGFLLSRQEVIAAVTLQGRERQLQKLRPEKHLSWGRNVDRLGLPISCPSHLLAMLPETGERRQGRQSYEWLHCLESSPVAR